MTAASNKLPVVVVDQSAGTAAYYVFDVAAVQASLHNVLSATPLSEALEVGTQAPREPLALAGVQSAAAGLPVVDNGRLLGVTAADKPDYPEPTEADLARAGTSESSEGGRKRGFWRRGAKSEG